MANKLSKRTQQLLQSYLKKPTPIRYQKCFDILLPFIESVTRRTMQKHGLPTWMYKEFLSDAWLAFESTMQKLDESKLATFKHFLGMKIRYAIMDRIRKETSGRSRYAPTPDEYSSLDWEGADHNPALEYSDSSLQFAEQDDDFEALIAGLDEVQQFIFRGIYLEGRLQKDVAKELGYAEGRISQQVNRTLKKLREEMLANNAKNAANND